MRPVNDFSVSQGSDYIIVQSTDKIRHVYLLSVPFPKYLSQPHATCDTIIITIRYTITRKGLYREVRILALTPISPGVINLFSAAENRTAPIARSKLICCNSITKKSVWHEK